METGAIEPGEGTRKMHPAGRVKMQESALNELRNGLNGIATRYGLADWQLRGLLDRLAEEYPYK
jgi:hypothetical protein